ncbi:MAG TPA: hypothetical protein VF297_11585 [Pyrinomonadaceae bacterium]
MSRKRDDAAESESKAELRRQMEEARESISETVAEIKSVVTHQYEEVRETVESVKEGVGEVLDWRTEFERNPLVWGAGAVSVGILVGFGIARAFDDKEEPRPRGRRKTVTTGEHVVAELSGFAEVVLPTISAKIKELFGLDLDAYLRAAHAKRPAPKRLAKKSARKGAAKKGASKKGAAKKGIKR